VHIAVERGHFDERKVVAHGLVQTFEPLLIAVCEHPSIMCGAQHARQKIG
jgi:hypothetical protein